MSNVQPCEYCGGRAVHLDHVIPKSLAKSYSATRNGPEIPAAWCVTVPACFSCNVRKGQQRLVPPSWRKHIAKLNSFFPGTDWRVFDGGKIPAGVK
ncbi:MAG TPA: hypothetical protein VF981_16575 [Gemmatimonadaceae bacterium]